MALLSALLEATNRALQNIGLPVRGIREQPGIAAVLGGFAREQRAQRQQYLSISEIHEVVYGCIRAIANTVAEIPIFLRKGKEIVEDRNDPVWQLLTKPNEYMGWSQLMVGIVWMLMATGNAFLEVVYTKRNKKPAELWHILDPVDIKVGETNRIEYYIVTVGGQQFRLEPNEVIHFRLFHPRNGYFGLSPIGALREGILADISAVQYNKTLYENLAVPVGVLKSEYEITEAKAREILQKWNERLRSGAGSVAILGRGMDWKPITISPRDVYYIQSRQLTRKQIQTVYGVPDLFLGEASNMSFSSATAAIRVFYENTIFPLLAQIQHVLNNRLLNLFGDYSLEFDRNRVPFLLEILQMRAQTHESLLRAGMPQREIWPLVWNKPTPLPDDIADISYVPGNVTQAGAWNQAISGPPPQKHESPEEIRALLEKIDLLQQQIQELQQHITADL
jgi:HK97 family phage portal protein